MPRKTTTASMVPLAKARDAIRQSIRIRCYNIEREICPAEEKSRLDFKDNLEGLASNIEEWVRILGEPSASSLEILVRELRLQKSGVPTGILDEKTATSWMDATNAWIGAKISPQRGSFLYRAEIVLSDLVASAADAEQMP